MQQDTICSFDLYICPKCSKEYNNRKSYIQHYSYCVKGKKPWNKGKTKDSDIRIKMAREKAAATIKKNGTSVLGSFSRRNREKFLENCRKGGLKSAEQSSNRSKNEIFFAELIKNTLVDSIIKTNSPQFGGWDADVIIEDKKIAILWNGIWHYKKVNKKHNFDQTLARDDKKRKAILSTGYELYEIQDMGKHDTRFVIYHFLKFLKIYFPDYLTDIQKLKTVVKNVKNDLPRLFELNSHLSKSYKLISEIRKQKSIEKRKEKEKLRRDKIIRKRAKKIYLIHLLRTSDIDFSKYGWCTEAAKILNTCSNKVSAWMKRNMPKFYEENCYNRSTDVALGKIKKAKKFTREKRRRFERILLIHRIRTANIDFTDPSYKQKILELYGNNNGIRWMQIYMPKFCREHNIRR